MGGSASSRLVRFGLFVADLRNDELRRNGRNLKIQEQPFQVLAALLERPGEIVTREELHQRIWPNEFVEFEHSLNVAVSKLREALGDSAVNPRFIETVPRHGYRFIAPVEPGKPRRWPRWLAAATIVLAAGAIMGGIFFLPQQRKLRAVPLISLVGLESDPAISPDGKTVAFTWTGEGEGYRLYGAPTDLYIQQVGGNTAVRLTDTPEREDSPAWSPDGSQIAFCRGRQGKPGFTIHVMKTVGGPEVQLGESKVHRRCQLAWSPGERLLTVVDQDSPEGPTTIYSLSVRTHERKRLTQAHPQWNGDSDPSFSPDGRNLAFVRCRHAWACDIYLLALTGEAAPDGEPQPLTSGRWAIHGLDWTPDGGGIVFSEKGHLWKMPVSGGRPEQLNAGEDARQPSISRRGDRLVYIRRRAFHWLERDIMLVENFR